MLVDDFYGDGHSHTGEFDSITWSKVGEPPKTILRASVYLYSLLLGIHEDIFLDAWHGTIEVRFLDSCVTG
jgi:hypothetical protein